MTTLFQQIDFAPRLLQKLVGFAIQPLGNANQTGQRKVILAAFNTADKSPVHISALGEGFLRQSHFFPKRAHVLCHPLAILIFHACQVWKKKTMENIDVTTIVFNTRQQRRTLADLSLLVSAESLGLRFGTLDRRFCTMPKRHRKSSGRHGESCRKILMSDESGKFSYAAGAKGRQTSKR